MSWFAEALKFIESPGGVKFLTGGVLGALATFGLSWRREHRRSLDAYQAPQRQAISDTLAANFDYQQTELDRRRALSELAQIAIQQQSFIDQSGGESMDATKAAGIAERALDHAFAIGRLTIVDPPAWEAMGAAYVKFDALRKLKTDPPGMRNAQEINDYLKDLADRAAELNSAVSALVLAGIDRLSPAETLFNPWRRRGGRRRLEQLYRKSLEADAGQQADTPRPHY